MLTPQGKIRKRLLIEIDKLNLGPERDRMARYTVERVVPVVELIVKEAVLKLKRSILLGKFKI